MIAKVRRPYRKVQKECKHCGARFVAGGQSKYCSRRCQIHGYRRTNNRTKRCEFCRKDYKTYDKEQRFCSVGCRSRSRSKPKAMIACKVCNKRVYRRERFGQTDANEFCSRSCAIKWRHMQTPPKLPRRLTVVSKPCKRCHFPFTPKSMSAQRCDACKAEVEEERRIVALVPRHMKECIECGNSYEGHDRSKYCSKRCGNRACHRTAKHRRRARMEGGDNITLHKLIQRDYGICQLCFLPVDMQADINKDGAAPTIDHVIPVSKNGTHTWDNVQLACRRCNYIKGDDHIETPGRGVRT